MIGNQRAVVSRVQDTVVIVVLVTSIARGITVMVQLIGVDDRHAVIGGVLDSILVHVLLPVAGITYAIGITVFL